MESLKKKKTLPTVSIFLTSGIRVDGGVWYGGVA
jgi:sRNA-binding regulator protein Hfq